MFTLDQDAYFRSDKMPKFVSHGFGTKKAKIQDPFNQSVIVKPEQTHSDTIFGLSYLNNQVTGDGIYTDKKNIILTVQTADCVPIIYVDKKKKIIGISHQGWKGTLKRLSQKMTQKFIDMGSEKDNIVVAIGPAIGACCYDIDEERLQAFKKEFIAYDHSIYEWYAGKTFLNLAYLNFLQLIEIGLTKAQIDFFPFCTKCNEDMFYSYRRSDMNSEMISFVLIK